MDTQPIRLHPNMLPGLVLAIQETLNGTTAPANLLKSCFRKHPNWGARDRKLVGRLYFDWLRWWRLYQYISGHPLEHPTFDPFLLLTAWSAHQNEKLPNWKEFDSIPQETFQLRYKEALSERVLQASIPDWLDDLGVKFFGVESWNDQLQELNRPAKLCLRVNRLKTSAKQVHEFLEKTFGLRGEIQTEEGIVLNTHLAIESSEGFKKGWFEIQDINSQKVAHWLAPQPGEKVLDACAGGGGKSLHLAQLMNNQGHILAEDLYSEKLKRLQQRAQRNGISIIKIARSQSNPQLQAAFDRVLLDVPCTGIGVLKRNPAAKWQMNPERLEKITQIQAELLQKNAKRVKPEGILLYVTCSLLEPENRLQIHKFLESSIGKEYILEEEFQELPASSGFDGFYGARLRRVKG
ncbi:MAG: RsmB/NOP family class I SAM-dependent RNA methyltransferase [Flavobacteriaceae bacterium]